MQQKGNDKNMKDEKLAELIVKLFKLKESKNGGRESKHFFLKAFINFSIWWNFSICNFSFA